MDKFGRNYSLTVQTLDGGVVQLGLPFSCEFDITRKTLASAQVCQLRLYNLGEKTRNKLRFNISNLGQHMGVVFNAGYGANPPTVFVGNVTQAWSYREGVNFITQIECFDAGFGYTNGITNSQFPTGTLNQAVIAQLANSIPYVTLGAVGKFPGTVARGASYSGNTCQILRELTGGAFFIDLQKAHALGTSEYIAGAVTVVDAKTGLLGTPVLEQYTVRFDMLFEPRLRPGYSALLTSLTGSVFNGAYKITSVKHRGMISDAVCGQAVTTGEFFYQNPLVPVAIYG